MTIQPLAVRAHPVKRYLIALLTTAAVYFCYLLVVTPFIDGQVAQVQEANQVPIGPPLPVDDKTEIAKYLPAGSWELQPCKSLDTAEGKILFQDYSRNEADGTWDVYPFTMVLKPRNPQPGKSPGPPLILRTEKQAKLRFSHGLQLGTASNGEPNKLEQAQLIGLVEVFQPGTDAGEAIHITTSNVQITQRKIFTLANVDFQFGNHHGRGRNLSIELSHESINSNLKADFSNINGIRRLQLAYLDFLRLEPNSKPRPSHANGTPLHPETAALEITCDGSFKFDFYRNQAAFRDNVRVKQLDQHGDSLACQKLDLYFNDLSDDPVAPRESEMLDSEFELSEIVAAGSPAILTINSRESRIQGEYLRYNLEKNNVEARGAVQQVEILQGPNRFVSQHLNYEISADNSLGKLNAFGPGMMIRQGETAGDYLQARWKNHLTIRRIDERKKVITLDGDSSIQLDPKTVLNSDTVRFVLWETRTNSLSGKPQGWNYQPFRLVATGHVQVRSKDIQGTTHTLTAHWPDNPLPFQATDEEAPLRPPSKTSQYLPARPPSHSITSSDATSSDPQKMVARRVRYPNEKEPPKQKLFFQGQELDMLLTDQDGTTNVTDLEIDGDVKVWRLETANKGGQPQRQIELSGHHLKAEPQGNENYRLQISAGAGTQSATVVTKDMILAGPYICLDQQANRVWINGPGSLVMNQPNEQTNKSNHKEIRSDIQDLKITWQGGMIFDGSKIYFERDVISNSVTQREDKSSNLTSTESAILSLELDQYVTLHTRGQGEPEVSAKRPQPKIKTLFLMDHLPDGKHVFNLAGFQQPTPRKPILIANVTRNPAGKITEQQKLVAPSATINVSANSLTADGPGALAIHRPNRSSATGYASPLSFHPTPKTDAPPLVFIQTNFDQTLRANSESKTMDITGNVRAVYVPVSSLNQSYNPDDQKTPPDAFRLSCTTLTMNQWTPQATGKEQSELRARGNARIISNQFTATAHEVRYDQGNDYLYLEGSARSDATLQTVSETGGKSARLVAEKIRYRPSDNSTKIENMKRATMRNR